MSTTAAGRDAGRERVRRRIASAGHPPVLGDGALYGIAGEIVRALEPLTEASPPAMLATLLTATGALIGRTAFATVGDARHYPIIFTTIAGDSARARKGTSLAAIRTVLDAAGPEVTDFLGRRVINGIGSGEALVTGAATGGDPACRLADGDAAADQSLLILEEELARILIVAQRPDSTLSSVMRAAWDGGCLESRTKHSRVRAERPHVCVLGHVTRHDLTGLSSKDIGNGFANRFLYVFSRRTQLLPEPGRLSDDQVAEFGERLMKAVHHARQQAEVPRTADFRDEWAALYVEIESQQGGGRIYEQLTARGAPQLLRLSLLYALLDESPVLDAPHLRAAAAFWEYCEATVAHLWSTSTGDPRADRLLEALSEAGDEGLSKKQIGELFSNNLSGNEVDRLRALLIDSGFATGEKRATGGRPSEVLVLKPPNVDRPADA